MIKSFAEKETEKLFSRNRSTKIPNNIQRISLRKLLLIDAAEKVEDLKIPPGNRLEKLTGNLKGKYSVRINDQYRIVFRFKDGNAHEVEITDYH